MRIQWAETALECGRAGTKRVVYDLLELSVHLSSGQVLFEVDLKYDQVLFLLSTADCSVVALILESMVVAHPPPQCIILFKHHPSPLHA